MSKHVRLPAVPNAIRKLLGPPPLLSTEDEKLYYAMLAHFAATVKGNDLVTWLLLKDAADARVEIARYRRFKALRIAICHEGNKKQTLAQFNREKKIEHMKYDTAFAKRQLAKQELSSEEKERHNARLDNALATAIAEVEAECAKLIKKLRAPDTDHDFALVFRRWVEDAERLDNLLRGAEERFKAALDELNWYQAGRFASLADEWTSSKGRSSHQRTDRFLQVGGNRLVTAGGSRIERTRPGRRRSRPQASVQNGPRRRQRVREADSDLQPPGPSQPQ